MGSRPMTRETRVEMLNERSGKWEAIEPWDLSDAGRYDYTLRTVERYVTKWAPVKDES